MPGRLVRWEEQGQYQRRTPIREIVSQVLYFSALLLSLRSRWTVKVLAYQLWIANQLPSQPQKWLLKVVIALGANVVILQVLFAMEGDGLGFDFAFFDVDLISYEHDGYIFTDTDQVTMPIRYVLVGNTRSDIKHDDAALPVDVVPIAKATELFLSGSIPHIELNRAIVLSGTVVRRVNSTQRGGKYVNLPA